MRGGGVSWAVGRWSETRGGRLGGAERSEGRPFGDYIPGPGVMIGHSVGTILNTANEKDLLSKM